MRQVTVVVVVAAAACFDGIFTGVDFFLRCDYASTARMRVRKFLTKFDIRHQWCCHATTNGVGLFRKRLIELQVASDTSET